jgi:predicted AAA+ superfamily ATPase
MLYLRYGGLPFLSNNSLTDEYVYEYLRNVYSTIILKDVVQRENIRNIDFLEKLLFYTADNVGNLFSANNISKYLKSQRTNIPTNQVINYLKSLGNAYIINKVGRIDINGLKKFEIGDKYYFEDIGLRNCQIGFSLQRDVHKLMENAVFLHLKNNKYEVFIGKKENLEIDFVAIKQGKKIYVQVAYLLADAYTIKREFGNLQTIPDNYPKYVVTLDDFFMESDFKGIKHLNLRDFLCLNEL